ncbi:MAG: 23S rRNA (guanosine(2251)-2'-O)-methyltransferase RlmB [Cyclobacteriaceae bacterium]
MKKEFVFGLHPVMEAIKSGQEIDKILVQKQVNEQLKEVLQQAHLHQVPIQKVPPEKLKRVTGKNHQGIIALMSAISFASLDHVIQSAYQQARDPFLLICDHITDVRNLGAIARSAECAGVDALVLPATGSAQINSDAIKTSAGALNHLPVCRDRTLKSAAEFIQNNGVSLVAVTEKAQQSIFDLDLAGPVCLVVGSEEKGIDPELINMAAKKCHIPMQGKIGSLNVSVAAAIVLYQVVRQRLISI